MYFYSGVDTNHYLYRFGLPKATKGNVERIYTLGSRGRDFLVNATGQSINWYFRPGRTATHNYSFLVHSLAVTRFLVAASYWSKTQKGLQLIQSRINYELANTPGKEEATIIPDGWLLFQRSDGKKGSVLLEIDRGTEYQERFKQHIVSRVEFVRSGAFERFFGERSVTVVYVAVGDLPYKETRRRTMLLWTKEVLKELGLEDWGSMFLFTDVGLDVYGAQLFDKAVWYSTESSKAGRLFGG